MMEMKTVPEGSQKNVMALSEATTMEKLGNGVSSCEELLAGYKEARVVLQDLRHTNLLTQQQRRELIPKRRRTSSVTSQRTKNLLKDIASEGQSWANDWTSSSVESVSIWGNRNRSRCKRKKKPSRPGKKSATVHRVCIKQEKDDLGMSIKQEKSETENIELVQKGKKKRILKEGARPLGRPRRKNIKLEAPKSPSIITISSTSYSTAAEIKEEKDLRLNPVSSTTKIEREKDLILNIMNPKAQQDNNLASSKGRGKRIKKKTVKSEMGNSKDFLKAFEEKESCNHKNIVSNRPYVKKIKEEILSPVKNVEKVVSGSNDLNVTQTPQVARSNKSDHTIDAKPSFPINGEPIYEDHNNLRPFVKPTRRCNLDLFLQTIEEVVAAGHSPSHPKDNTALSSDLSTSTNNPKENNCNDPQASRVDEPSYEVWNLSVGSSESTRSCESGKRKLPEIIQDSVLPRGTFDIPSVKPKPPCDNRKRKIVEKKVSESQSQKQNSVKKSVEIKSKSGSRTVWPSQPEIPSDFNTRGLAIDKNHHDINWDDTLNNNQFHSSINDSGFIKSNDKYIIDSSSRVTPSPHSSATDEYKAMTNLLSSMDDPSAVENLFDNAVDDVLFDSENLRNSETLKLVDTNQEIPNRTNQIEKLTTKNLNRFNKNGTESVNSPSLAQSVTVSDKIEVGNGEVDYTSGGSEKSRKRKWVPNEANSGLNTQKNKMNEKIVLVRKHWENQGKWALDKPNTSSSGLSEICPRLSKLKTTEKTEKPLMTSPVLNQVQLKTTNRNINNNYQKSDSLDNLLRESGRDTDEKLPSFGEPNVHKAASPRLSNASSSFPSSSSSSSLSSDRSSSPNSKSDLNRQTSIPATIQEVAEKDQEFIKMKRIKEFKIPLLSKNNAAETTIEKIKTTETSKKLELRVKDTKSTDEDIRPVTIDPKTKIAIEKVNRYIRNESVHPVVEVIENPESSENSKVHRYETDQGFDEIIMEVRLNEVQSNVGEGEIEKSHECKNSFNEDELDELIDAETLARKENTAGGISENEDEDDCLSILYTESLATSGNGSNAPPLHNLPKSSALPSSDQRQKHFVKPAPQQEPYTRMKSSNIGKYLTENNRECEEILKALKDNATTSETTFDNRLTKASLNSVPEKPPEKEIPTTHRDLRTTLNSRMISRDIPAQFFGRCFAWLRGGHCKNTSCRFKHSLEPKLEDIQKYDVKNIEEILNYAMNQGYCNFIELVLNKAMINMTTLKIKGLYSQLYKMKLLTIPHIDSIADALRTRGLTSADIVATLSHCLNPEDADARSKIQAAMYKKVEPQNWWNVLGELMIQSRPPVSVIETIMEETIRKNCLIQARAIYEYILRRLPSHVATEIRRDVWDKFNKVRIVEAPRTSVAPIQNAAPDADFGSAFRNNISPESPRPERVATPVESFSIKSPSIEPPIPQQTHQPPLTLSKESWSHSSSDLEDTSYSLQPIDKLPMAKSPYRDHLWKFHWDLQGMQEGLKHKDYAHVITILKQYVERPNRLPHIEGFYKILIKEITSAKHHLVEIVRLTVQSGSSNELRLFVYDLGIYVVTKLADIGAWIHAYELLKIFQVYGSYNTCAFTLLAAQVYIANRRPSKALDLLEKSRIVCTNGRKWRQLQCQEDGNLRSTVLDLLLYSLCDGSADDALRLLDFILRDQCSTFKPINLIPHVDRIARLLLSEKRTNLVIEVSRIILQAKLFVSVATFRGLINRVFHDDLVLARQLHQHATWLGVYNKAKINTASCIHMIINVDWTEEETYLMISSLLNDLHMNIGHAIDRIKVRQLNVFLILEVIPSDQQLTTDVSSDGKLSVAAMNKRRATVKNVLNRFDPKIKMIQRYQGRICKLQSRSLIAYLKSGHEML